MSVRNCTQEIDVTELEKNHIILKELGTFGNHTSSGLIL